MIQYVFSVFDCINRLPLIIWEQGTWISTRENYILLLESLKKVSEIKGDPP